MKSRGQRKPGPVPAEQLAAEIEWLINTAGAGYYPGCDTAGTTRVDHRWLPSLVRPGLATRIEDILRRPELVPLLNIIERHNSRPRLVPGRRVPQKDHFLLAPHLFQVLASVEARNEMRRRFPVLDQPAAEVRDHLQNVAASCKALAKLIHKGPQPHVALAGETSANAALKVFAPWTKLFEDSDDTERQVVAFTELMERAAGWFGALAAQVPRAKQNRNTNPGMLRRRVAEFFLRLFTERLFTERLGDGDPCRTHVATITTIVSGIETHADFVRQMELQQTGATRRRQKERLTQKKSDALP